MTGVILIYYIMDLRELRRGNLFNIIDRTREVHMPIPIVQEVLEIRLFKVMHCLTTDKPCEVQPNFTEANDVSPIALTPAFLISLGFERGSDIMGECWFIEDANYDLDFALHVENNSFKWVGNNLTIKYVHQLQNLFYALNGIELEYKTS